MEINVQHETTSATWAAHHERVSRSPQPNRDVASLRASELITQGLQLPPDGRSGEVERAKSLINHVQYPPAEMRRKIARLLAMEE